MSRVLLTGINQITQSYQAHCDKVSKGLGWAKGTDIVAYHNKVDKVCSHSAGCVVKVVDYITGHEQDKEHMGYGNYVIVSCFSNPDYYFLYAHLAPGSVKVKVGQFLSEKQEIGTMGDTGNSFGAHLHFEIRKKTSDNFGKNGYWHDVNSFEWINPEPYIDSALVIKNSTNETKKTKVTTNWQIGAFTIFANAENYRLKYAAKFPQYKFYVYKDTSDNTYKVCCNGGTTYKDLGIGFKKQKTIEI